MFDSFELSRFLGRPVHLFLFTRQTLTWRFASGARDIVIAGNRYRSAPGIERGKISQTCERAKSKLTIKMPYLLDPNAPEFPVTQNFGGNFRPFPAGDVVGVTCMAVHSNDGELEAAVEWMGRVSAQKFTDTQLTLTCEPTRSNSRLAGNPGRWCTGCPLALYGSGTGQCNVDPATHAAAGTLTDVTGLALTAEAFAGYSDGRLEGGYIEWQRVDGLYERRSIMSHAGSVITIDYGANDLASGLVVTAHPGCAHDYDDCNDYFNNAANYGGNVYMSTDNPMDGHRIAW